jgi:peptidoglycan/xylan/chitin deacetylase (PgdA/CDA1 family)
VAEGHEVGNHSLTHPAFTKIGLDGVAPELDQTEQIIRETLGVSSRPYFRFPYGDSNPAVVDLIARDGYVAYHWSADDAAIQAWLDRAAANPRQAYGGILLMHGRPSTVAALPGWLDRLSALGLQPVTLGTVLR